MRVWRARGLTCVAFLLTTAAMLALPMACSQITGADKNRVAAVVDGGHVSVVMVAPDAQVSTLRECGANEKKCEGACVPIDDPAYGCSPTECGARCAVAFADVVTCTNGKCSVGTCQPGHADCNKRGDDGCEADLTEPGTCGDCGKACGGGAPPYCDNGQCTFNCNPPKELCGAKCTLVATDPNNCGMCTKVCPTGPNANPSCTAGACGFACLAGFKDCNTAVAGCEPKLAYYADNDSDGYGVPPKVGEDCAPPTNKFSLLATDCNDNNASVKPGQTAYFTAPYTATDGKTLSFDYNCSGFEDSDPTKAIGKCPICVQGYATGGPPRMVAPNKYCGSTVFNTCGSEGCAVASAPAFGCH